MNIDTAVAVISGANRGIGRSLVEALLDRGAPRIYATARRLADLGPIVALDPKRIHALQLDITNAGDIAAAAKVAHDANLLINNAGVLAFGSLLDVSVEALRRDMDTNYYGTLHMTRAFAPVIEKNGDATVVNILTLAALVSLPAIGAYNASKAAAWSMTLSLRADLGRRNIRVIGVFPGAVDTDMARHFEMSKTSPADVARAVVEGVASGAEDIFPDPMSRQMYAAWKADHKAVERQFAAM